MRVSVGDVGTVQQRRGVAGGHGSLLGNFHDSFQLIQGSGLVKLTRHMFALSSTIPILEGRKRGQEREIITVLLLQGEYCDQSRLPAAGASSADSKGDNKSPSRDPQGAACLCFVAIVVVLSHVIF